MGPVVVTATLTGPMIDRGDPVHLDGLLAAAWVMRHCQGAHISRLDDLADAVVPHLPLGRLTVGDRSVWLASAAEPMGHHAPAVVWQTRRRDMDDWDRLAAPVNVAAGPTKNALLRTGAHLVGGLKWLAWGRRREIDRALRLLWGHGDDVHGWVGSSRRSGSGEIADWRCVGGDHEIGDVLVSHDGVIRRHMPAEWLDGIEHSRIGACAPPYWHPQRREPTASVGSPGRLRLEVRQALREMDDE